jgi:hypothetical protein
MLPTGVILMWSGSSASIPYGWLLCDGNNSTPNLQDRFIVGASSNFAVGATGGSANAVVVSHTHTATSAVTDPGHTHSLTLGLTNLDQGPAGGGSSVYGSTNTASSTTGISVATTVNSAGSSGTNANLPPYYALCYIMKS